MRTRRLLPLLFCLALCACPYGSPVPLDAPEKGTLDARLLGKWVQTGESAGTFAEVEFHDFNGREYYVEIRSHEPYKPLEVDRYRVFSSVVGGRTFLNCQQRGFDAKSDARFFLAVYEFKDKDTLDMSLVSDAAMKSAPELKTSKALRRFIEAHLKDKDLFEPGFVLKRP